jgi:hypothetical protein
MLTEFVCNILAGRTPLKPKDRPLCVSFFTRCMVEPYVVTYAILMVSPMVQKSDVVLKFLTAPPPKHSVPIGKLSPQDHGVFKGGLQHRVRDNCSSHQVF